MGVATFSYHSRTRRSKQGDASLQCVQISLGQRMSVVDRCKIMLRTSFDHQRLPVNSNHLSDVQLRTTVDHTESRLVRRTSLPMPNEERSVRLIAAMERMSISSDLFAGVVSRPLSFNERCLSRVITRGECLSFPSRIDRELVRHSILSMNRTFGQSMQTWTLERHRLMKRVNLWQG